VSASLLALLLLTAPAGPQTVPPKPPTATRPASSPAPASDRETLLKHAAEALAAGHREEAARLLQAAAERFHSVRALLELARLQSSAGDARSALASLRKARELAPNAEDVLSAYAQLSLAARTPLPAMLVLEPLTRMCPRVAQYHYLRGVALMQAGDMVAAGVSLQQAEHLEPNRVLTLIALAIALNNQKIFADARGYLLRALELEPDNLEAVAALAEAEEGLGELEPAEKHAGGVLTRAATHVTGNLVMGMVRMKQARYAEARDLLETAVAAEPTSQKAHYQLSLAYARLGDTLESRRHLELYQQARKDTEERLIQMRTATGLPGEGGMHR
jgi:Flp pilus assembly protein TadD